MGINNKNSIFKKNHLKLIPLALLITSFKVSYADLSKKYNQIEWEKIKEEKKVGNEIIWVPLDTDKIIDSKSNINPPKNIIHFNEESQNKRFKNMSPFVEIGPLIPLNNFPNEGSITHKFKQKSSFSGGDAGGTGNQIYTYRVDLGISDSFFISGFITEADDPFYSKIKKENQLENSLKNSRDNYWRQYAFYFLKNIYRDKTNQISFGTSFEYWSIVSYYRKLNGLIDYGHNEKIIGSFSIPFTKMVNNNLKFIFIPKFVLLPNNFGEESDDNFYNNNFHLGTGLNLKLNNDLYFNTSYTIPLGPGSNSFNDDLYFSRKNIYSYGIRWHPNQIVSIQTSLSNAFGETPATSFLTIPSDDITLYSLGIELRPNMPDTPIKNPSKNQRTLAFGGTTVSNAYPLERGENKFSINFDSKSNLFGSYIYSISNIFQLEMASLSTINNFDKRNVEYKVLKDTYFNDGNFHTRFGGKLNLLSPLKGDSFWLSTRITVGRDQTSVQGYFFSDLQSTFELKENIFLNLNPKYSWNSFQNLGGLGISLNYNIKDKFVIIPEMNINTLKTKQGNSSLTLRYISSPNRSYDFYISNALGTHDMSQLLKSDSTRIGTKLNFIF